MTPPGGLTLTLADIVPVAVGANWTLKVQAAPGASVPSMAQLLPATTLNWPALGPEMVAENGMAVVPLLAKVKGVDPATPTATLPKSWLAGEMARPDAPSAKSLLIDSCPARRRTIEMSVVCPGTSCVITGCCATQLASVLEVTCAQGTGNASSLTVTAPDGKPPTVMVLLCPGVTSTSCVSVVVPVTVTSMQLTSVGTFVTSRNSCAVCGSPDEGDEDVRQPARPRPARPHASAKRRPVE